MIKLLKPILALCICSLSATFLLSPDISADDLSDWLNARQDSQFAPSNIQQTDTISKSINSIRAVENKNSILQDGEGAQLQNGIAQKTGRLSGTDITGSGVVLQKRRGIAQGGKETATIVEGVTNDMLALIDIDGDGVLDPTDGYVADRFFALADDNKDGIIDKDEIEKLWEDYGKIKTWYDAFEPGSAFGATQWRLDADGTWVAYVRFDSTNGELPSIHERSIFLGDGEEGYTIRYLPDGTFIFISDSGECYTSYKIGTKQSVLMGGISYAIEELDSWGPPDLDGDGDRDEDDVEMLRRYDFDGNGGVNFRDADVLCWSLQWRASGQGDLNQDGNVDNWDMMILHMRLQLQSIGPIDDAIIRKADTNHDGVLDGNDYDAWFNIRAADCNGDGFIDGADREALYQMVSEGGYDDRYDLDRDGILGERDIDKWVEMVLGADVNGDTIITQKDADLLRTCITKATLERELKESGGCEADGDIDGDGDEDLNDACILERGIAVISCGDINGDGLFNSDDVRLLESRIAELQANNAHPRISLIVTKLLANDFNADGIFDLKDIKLASAYGVNFENGIRPITITKHTANDTGDGQIWRSSLGGDPGFFSGRLRFRYENPIAAEGKRPEDMRKAFGVGTIDTAPFSSALRAGTAGTPIFFETVTTRPEQSMQAVYVKKTDSKLSDEVVSAGADSALEKTKEDINAALGKLENPSEEARGLADLASGLIDETRSEMCDAGFKEQVKEFADTVRRVLAYTAIGVSPEAISALFTKLSEVCQEARAACENDIMKGYYEPLYGLFVDESILPLWWQNGALSPDAFFNHDKKELMQFALDKIGSCNPESEELKKRKDHVIAFKDSLYQSCILPALSAYQKRIQTALSDFNRETEKILKNFTGASVSDSGLVIDAAFVLPQQ